MDCKVVIGVPTAEYARRADFYDYFNLLEKPAGTAITFAHGQSPARNRNVIIEQALKIDATHIMFIDDDTAFPRDMLMKLLSHDVDIVTALYLMRNFPHRPIIFDMADEEGRCLTKFLTPGSKGLVEIVAAGLGACLIKTSVFAKIDKPWIRLGELEKDHWCDDIGFFRRVRQAGIKVHCDLDIRVGHIASMIVWPELQGDTWYTKYDTAGEGSALVPQQFPVVTESEKEDGTKLSA